MTPEQAREQVLAWMGQGLPQGSVSAQQSRVCVEVRDVGEVLIWASALGATAAFSRGFFGLVYPLGIQPVALGGWALDVWCPVTDVPPFRIERR